MNYKNAYEELKRIDEYHLKIIGELKEENKQLKERVDKAIECINYYAIENEDYGKIYSTEEQELLEILKGE